MAFRLPAIFLLCFLVARIASHGMLTDPPGRSSLWRTNPKAPTNYDDDENYCGGASVQWSTYGGKCGVCGDPYGAPHPQNNENTGKYGRGIIAKSYQAGSVVRTQVTLTTNHLGFFLFSLCTLTNPNAIESGEDCFEPLKLANGESRYNVKGNDARVTPIDVQLPPGKTCERCVLRWHYTAGNNWGPCGNGTSALGCGPQESFRSCADISIL